MTVNQTFFIQVACMPMDLHLLSIAVLSGQKNESLLNVALILARFRPPLSFLINILKQLFIRPGWNEALWLSDIRVIIRNET